VDGVQVRLNVSPHVLISKFNMADFWSSIHPFVNGGASGMAATCCIQPIDMVKVRCFLPRAFSLSKQRLGYLGQLLGQSLQTISGKFNRVFVDANHFTKYPS
jgi:hypothetical protein